MLIPYAQAYFARHKLFLDILDDDEEVVITSREDKIAYGILKLISYNIVRKPLPKSYKTSDITQFIYRDSSESLSWVQWFAHLNEILNY